MELKSMDMRDTMTIKDLQHNSYQTALHSGFHDEEKLPLEAHMLMVTEIAEASEALRTGEPAVYKVLEGIPITPSDDRFYTDAAKLKPEGEATELADTVIRIMDYFGQMGWDFETVVKIKADYNVTRPYMHGRVK